MKKIYSILALAAALSLATSCFKSLDTLPLDPTEFTSENAYTSAESYLQGLSYINAYYSFVSQGDPGSSDLNFSDAGQSELLRQYINLNEMSADALKCAWGDPYVDDIQYGRWTTAVNDATEAVYTRCMKGIALVNEYLIQTETEKLEARGHTAFAADIAGYRAEARFHRCMFYWIMMDLFGNPPFAGPENIGGELPRQIKRADLFTWIEGELNDLLAGNDMPAKGAVPYPRPNKGSVQALLAEMYLNAEVYTGTAQWQKAKDAAGAVIGMGYSLEPVYENLFMQDNTTNGAAEREFVFAIEYDKDHAQSWGSTTTFMDGTMDDDANAAIATLLGIPGTIMADTWNGYHVPDDYVARFNLQEVSWDGEGFGYNRETSDKRAFFFNQGKKDWDNSDVSTGWRCWKFSGRYTDGHVNDATVDNFKFSSCDFPIFRLAEMYLIYAEADARLHDGTVSDDLAVGYVKALRDRAGVETPSTIDLDFLLDERARELMWEGHRRVDLIRYGYFTSAQFPWTMKGGVANGKTALESFRTIYPIIMADKNANKNLEQNPGY